jgi:hypothetical protein
VLLVDITAIWVRPSSWSATWFWRYPRPTSWQSASRSQGHDGRVLAADAGPEQARAHDGIGLGILYAVAQIVQTVGLAHDEASRSGFLTSPTSS